MTRLRADALLLLTAAIWGAAFIAQKTGMQGLGPFGFNGARFILSFLVVLPFALRERGAAIPRAGLFWLVPLCLVFFAGVVLQQVGLLTTAVTNAGFLTGLYVVFTPLVAWAFHRHRPRPLIWAACGVAVFGTFLLGGGGIAAFGRGDWMVVASSVCFAAHVVLVGYLVQRMGRPLFFVAVQYAFCAVVGLTCAGVWEGISWDSVMNNAPQLLYAGVISGGIAYTLQAVAQQYAPPADAALILSTEALFAALAGVTILGDRLSAIGWAGCGLIFMAVMMVEAPAMLGGLRRRFRQ